MTIEEKFYKLYQENCTGLSTRDSYACDKCLLRKKANDVSAHCSYFMDEINYEIKRNGMIISDNPVICDCVRYMYNARYNRKTFDNNILIDKARFCCLCDNQFDCKKMINDYGNCEEFVLKYGIEKSYERERAECEEMMQNI